MNGLFEKSDSLNTPIECFIFNAEEFLIFTDFDLNYISQETGFSDCSHFIKIFKKYKGLLRSSSERADAHKKKTAG